MLLVHLVHREHLPGVQHLVNDEARVVNDEAVRDVASSRASSCGRGSSRRYHPTSAHPQAQSSLNTLRPVTGCAGHMKRCAAPSASIRHTITRGCRALLRAEIPFLADTAVFDRIWLPFIVRVVPSKCASLIGKGLILYPHLLVELRLGPILDLFGLNFGALDF